MNADSRQIHILYQYIMGSPLKNLITGQVYKEQRPNSSVDEDIVINSLGITGAEFQRGVCNVNIYVPDILATVGNKKQYVQNVTRLDTLATLAMETLKGVFTQEYHFRCTNQYRLSEPDANQHYINLRIDFRFLPS